MSVAIEKLIALKAVPKYYQEKTQGLSTLGLATVYRWGLRGIKGVRLETQTIGGVAYTTIEALERFDKAVEAARMGIAAIGPSTPKQRQAAHEAAKKRLRI